MSEKDVKIYHNTSSYMPAVS